MVNEIIESAAVTNVISETLNDTILVFNWQLPNPTNGDIQSYTIRITFYDGGSIREESVTDRNFTATGLSK